MNMDTNILVNFILVQDMFFIKKQLYMVVD